MSILEKLGLGGREAPSINELLQMISKRAERLDPKQQMETFVSLGIEQALLNTDNRIIFGRRGTGKTHVMAFVAEKARRNGDLVIQIDLRSIGSNGNLYSDANLPLAERTTRLLRDFLSALQYGFIDAITAPKSRYEIGRLSPAVEKLGEAVKTVVVQDRLETRRTTGGSSETTVGAEVEAKASTFSASLGGKAKSERREAGADATEITGTGRPRLSVNIGDTNRTLQDVAQRIDERIWILIDEWSSIPEALQPCFADFVKRAFFPLRNYTVHIAAIEHRSRFREGSGATTVGIELGSDASADIDLDDFLVFENNPEKSLGFFRQVIFRHTSALNDSGRPLARDVDEFVQRAFTQDRAFKELVRASEGVPRDAIHILQKAATRAVDQRISIPLIQSAAGDWYEQDKLANISEYEVGRSFLRRVTDTVIGERKCRAFLVRSDERSDVLDRLFDERILHIAKKSYSAKHAPGVRYKVWKMDYGCYVNLFNTASAPTGFLFEDLEPDKEWTSSVPEDDLRAIRRAVLNLDDFPQQAIQQK